MQKCETVKSYSQFFSKKYPCHVSIIVLNNWVRLFNSLLLLTTFLLLKSVLLFSTAKIFIFSHMSEDTFSHGMGKLITAWANSKWRYRMFTITMNAVIKRFDCILFALVLAFNCGNQTYLTQPTGEIKSHAGYDAGHNYGRNLDCSWTIAAPPGKFVELVAEDFTLESTST